MNEFLNIILVFISSFFIFSFYVVVAGYFCNIIKKYNLYNGIFDDINIISIFWPITLPILLIEIYVKFIFTLINKKGNK